MGRTFLRAASTFVSTFGQRWSNRCPQGGRPRKRSRCFWTTSANTATPALEAKACWHLIRAPGSWIPADDAGLDGCLDVAHSESPCQIKSGNRSPVPNVESTAYGQKRGNDSLISHFYSALPRSRNTTAPCGRGSKRTRSLRSRLCQTRGSATHRTSARAPSRPRSAAFARHGAVQPTLKRPRKVPARWRAQPQRGFDVMCDVVGDARLSAVRLRSENR